jgi:hypothetical protein
MVIDENQYFNPFRTDGLIFGSRVNWTYPQLYTLPDWRTFSGWELHSTFNASGWDFSRVSGIKPDQFVRVFMNWSGSSHEFKLGTAGFKDLKGADINGILKVPAYSSKVLFYSSGSLKNVDDPIYSGPK